MKENNRKTGSRYEQMAEQFLNRQGIRVIETNYYCRFGEIDLIAKDGNYIVFIEVKGRKSITKGAPAEAVTKKKQQTIMQCALYYMVEKFHCEMPCRFDVISVLETDCVKIQWIKDAFMYQR